MAVRPPTFIPHRKLQRKRDPVQFSTDPRPWRGWYSLAVWKRIRIAQLVAEPLCRRHAARGEAVAADTVNHVVRHRGVWALFVAGPFESLCKACHDGEVQREEHRASRVSGVKG